MSVNLLHELMCQFIQVKFLNDYEVTPMPLPTELSNIFAHKQKSYKMKIKQNGPHSSLTGRDDISNQREVSYPKVRERFLTYFQDREVWIYRVLYTTKYMFDRAEEVAELRLDTEEQFREWCEKRRLRAVEVRLNHSDDLAK